MHVTTGVQISPSALVLFVASWELVPISGNIRSKEVVAYAAAFTGPLAGNAVLALLGTLQSEWSISGTTVLLTIPVFMFPFAIMQLFSGTVSDAYDRRATVSFGLAVYAIGAFAGAASPSFVFFMSTRFFQGVGYAFVQPVLVAMISDIAGAQRQGLAMGYYGSSTTAGVAAGPLLAGLLAEIDWRLTFIAIGVLAVAVLVAIRLLFGRDEETKGRLSAHAVSTQLGSALRNWGVASLSISGFTAFFAFVGVMSFVSEYLDSGPIDASPSEIGLALAISGLTGIVLSPVAGRLVDRTGPRCCVSVGFAIVGTSSFLIQFGGSMEHFVVLLAISGVGTSFVWSALLTMVVRAYPELKGTSSSVFNSARFMGYAFSPVVLSPLFVMLGFKAVMSICAALCVFALAFALSARNKEGT